MMPLIEPRRLIFALWLTIATCCCLVGCQSAQLRPKNLSNTDQQTIYKLKFQVDLNNSTIIKEENQQQIFKCQVKLAPTSYLSKLIKTNKSVANSSHYLEKIRLLNYEPIDLQLTIDWFKNDQLITEKQRSSSSLFDLFAKQDEPEAVSIVNIEFRANSSSTKDKKFNSKARIEIKNTVNNNQLKLSSRLRLNQLKQSDSGQYRCLARAKFGLVNADINGTKQLQLQSVSRFEQTSESSESILLVKNNTLRK